MKKLLSLLLITALLCGCDGQNTQTTTTTASETTTITTTTPQTSATTTTTTQSEVYINVDTDTKIEVNGETVIDVFSPGYDYILALTKEGNVYSEGRNWEGALATGDFENRAKLTKIDFPEKIKMISECAAVGVSNTIYHWGVSYYPNEEIEYYNIHPQNEALEVSPNIHTIPFEKEIVYISKSWDFLNVLTADGEVYTYGAYCEYDPYDDIVEESAYTDIYPLGSMTKVDIGEKAVQISSGDTHTIVLGESGAVYGYGSSSFGQLGKENLDSSKIKKFDIDFKCVDIYCNVFNSYLVSESGEVYVYGSIEREKEYFKPDISGVVDVSGADLQNVVFSDKNGEKYILTYTEKSVKKADGRIYCSSGIYISDGAFYIEPEQRNEIHRPR